MAKKKKRSAKAGGGKGRGSGGGAARRGADEAFLEEAAEEMVALEAIFGAEFAAHEDGRGFDLRVVPHPGEAEANFVAATLKLRYPNQYPSAQLTLKLEAIENLQAAEVRRIAKALHTAAAQHARDDEVCAFNLVTIAQEQLQELNTPPENSEKKSLWHEMQARSDTDAVDLSAADPVWQDFQDDIGGGLFGDDAPILALPVLDVKRRQSVEQAGVSPVMVERAPSGSSQPLPGQPARVGMAGGGSSGSAAGGEGAAAEVDGEEEEEAG
eukprot:jgi/Tetstr1/457900/TSEL_044419.t1